MQPLGGEAHTPKKPVDWSSAARRVLDTPPESSVLQKLLRKAMDGLRGAGAKRELKH